MATCRFPALKLKKEDIQKLLGDGPMKGFNRLAIQSLRRKDDTFILVAMLIDDRRKRVADTPVIFIEEDKDSTKYYETSEDVMFFQHELTKVQVMNLSDHGKKDILLTPKKKSVNPDGVEYEPINPCPPADPPTP